MVRHKTPFFLGTRAKILIVVNKEVDLLSCKRIQNKKKPNVQTMPNLGKSR